MTIDIKVIFVESESCYTVWLQCFMYIFALFFVYHGVIVKETNFNKQAKSKTYFEKTNCWYIILIDTVEQGSWLELNGVLLILYNIFTNSLILIPLSSKSAITSLQIYLFFGFYFSS